MTDQNSQFFAMLTAVGEAKQANADALGIAWKITQMGVGDANGTDPIPNRLQTTLLNERRRAPLNQLKVDPNNASILIAEQVIPEDVGGWWIREIGLYDEAGDLVAIANCAPSFKPQLSQGSGRTQVVRMNFIVSSAANVELKIDPSVVLATRKYVDDELAKLDHKQSVRYATTAAIALAGLAVQAGGDWAAALTAGDRVLVKNQAAGKDNGLYAAAAGAWLRVADADGSPEVTSGLVVAVEQGTALADTRWQLVTDGAIVLGTTALVFQNVTQGFAPLSSPAFLDNPTCPTPAQFDNDLSLVNSEFVKRAQGSMAGSKSISVSTVLTGADVGHRIEVTGSGITLTLPVAAALPDGSSLLISNANRAPFITTQGAEPLALLDIGVTLPYQLPNQCDILLVAAAGTWRGYGLAAVYRTFSQGASLGASGYQKLPSGKIRQWGVSGVIPGGANLVITLPIAAPIAIDCVNATFVNEGADISAGDYRVPQVRGRTLTSFTLRNLSSTASQYFWEATCR